MDSHLIRIFDFRFVFVANILKFKIVKTRQRQDEKRRKKILQKKKWLPKIVCQSSSGALWRFYSEFDRGTLQTLNFSIERKNIFLSKKKLKK